MKKLLIVFLALILILGGLFLWKGGHHAIVLADALEDWLDEDAADQTLSLQVSIPTFEVGDQIEPVVRQISLFADTFWTEYRDRPVIGMTAGGCSAYLIDNTLYMDTGRAYALPEVRTYLVQVREFLTGLLLYGQVTKTDHGYRVEMEREELSFSAQVSLERGIRAITVDLDFTQEGQPIHVLAVLTPKETQSHPLPQAVLDAMVRAQMEPPMAIAEPLSVMLPALKTLMPLEADVKLGVECGILTLSETVGLSMDGTQALLIRNGQEVPLELPEAMTGIDPMAAGLLLLRNGEFLREGETSQFLVTLPAEATAMLVAQLVPQAAELGITFEQSEAILTIAGDQLSQVRITAGGSVPFLVTTIPLSFSAEFDIK